MSCVPPSKNGSAVSDLALCRAGHTRAQVDDLYATATRLIGVCRHHVGIIEVHGIRVWDASEWVLPSVRCLRRVAVRSADLG
jgi:hypothetical protein